MPPGGVRHFGSHGWHFFVRKGENYDTPMAYEQCPKYILAVNRNQRAEKDKRAAQEKYGKRL